jgi:hypothetical protein
MRNLLSICRWYWKVKTIHYLLAFVMLFGGTVGATNLGNIWPICFELTPLFEP